MYDPSFPNHPISLICTGFALTRALLRQVKQLPLAKPQQKTVSDQITTVVRRNTKIQSPAQVSTALDLGYETLEALHSQTAWKNILMAILETGAQRTAALRYNETGSEAQTKVKQAPKYGPNGAHSRVGPYPGSAKTLDRPFTTLSGRRRVPKLVNANRVPFLRLKKPQSPYVSRIIRDTINTREKRITLANELDEQLPTARDEDEWDQILFDHFGLKADNKWSSELRMAIRENGNLQAAATQKRTDLAAQMWSIVREESALAHEEKLRIRDEKHKRTKARRLERREQGLPGTEQDLTPIHAESVSGYDGFKTTGRNFEATMPMEAVPEETVPELVVRDKEKFRSKEEIERIRAANALSRTAEERAEIKAARARRKEEAAKAKADRVRRKEGNVQYWQQKLENHSNNAASDPDLLSPPETSHRKGTYAVVEEGLRPLTKQALYPR